jgi:hypothetical protein
MQLRVNPNLGCQPKLSCTRLSLDHLIQVFQRSHIPLDEADKVKGVSEGTEEEAQ